MTLGWIVAGALLLVGCKQELKTADYLYPAQNFLTRVHLVEDNAYVVSYGQWKGRTLTVMDYSVITRQFIKPMVPITISIGDNEIVDARLVKTVRIPLSFDTSKDFPVGSGMKIIATNEKFTANGTELSPCIHTKGQTGEFNEAIYCAGTGLVWKKTITISGRVNTTEVNAIKRFPEPKPADEQTFFGILLDDSYAKALPADQQRVYQHWIHDGACSSQVNDHGVVLGSVTKSLACGCLYNADLESAEVIVANPKSAIPLGTGTDAQEYYGKAVSCVREATGFKGPLS